MFNASKVQSLASQANELQQKLNATIAELHAVLGTVPSAPTSGTQLLGKRGPGRPKGTTKSKAVTKAAQAVRAKKRSDDKPGARLMAAFARANVKEMPVDHALKILGRNPIERGRIVLSRMKGIRLNEEKTVVYLVPTAA